VKKLKDKVALYKKEKDEYLKKQTLESLTLQVKNFFNKKITNHA
jgi:hypothetical protein